MNKSLLVVKDPIKMQFIEFEENVITEFDLLETEILGFWRLLGGKYVLNRKKVMNLVEIFKEFKEKKFYYQKGFYLGHNSPPGSGKSTVLLLIAYFARKEGYTVIYIPNGFYLSSNFR